MFPSNCGFVLVKQLHWHHFLSFYFPRELDAHITRAQITSTPLEKPWPVLFLLYFSHSILWRPNINTKRSKQDILFSTRAQFNTSFFNNPNIGSLKESGCKPRCKITPGMQQHRLLSYIKEWIFGGFQNLKILSIFSENCSQYVYGLFMNQAHLWLMCAKKKKKKSKDERGKSSDTAGLSGDITFFISKLL